ncbi:glycosyltransferase [Leptothermofonsia sp. ETS-13]|uniref:glycosyltransferase n=1 Tax=Leptothermofonsia sp. ETS-13 TaxID=3035696 RepID=UPI003B9FBFF9
MTQSSFPFVSVIVPVFNDAIRLKQCLLALEQQTYPHHRYEVVVVDNGSDADQHMGELVLPFEQATLVYESQPGSYAARNRGIAVAKGTVIAFTDADCTPAFDWIEQGVRALLVTPNCGFVAGKIEPSFLDKAHPTPIELYESLWYALPQQEFVEKHHFGATANMFTFARVIQQVGAFDGSLKSNGDREWGQRVHAAGYQPVYAETVCVTHPARHSFQQLYARARRITGGRYDLQRKHSFLKRNSLFVFNLVKYLIAPILMVGFNLFLDRRLKTVQQKIQVSLVMFFVSYVYVIEMLRLKCGGTSYRG